MRRAFFKGTGVIVCAAIFLLIGLFSAGFCAQPESQPGNPPGNQEAKDASKYVAYYFYTSRRCGPCTRIEQWSQAAVEQTFQDEIAAGRLQWQALNVEKPENKHFVKDFQLYTKSVIIAEYAENRDGQPIRWKNLADVWRLYHDEEKYFDYVAREVRAFMEKK